MHVRAGGRRQETGDRGQETRGKREEAGCRRQETGLTFKTAFCLLGIHHSPHKKVYINYTDF